ncbi:MAG: energy transducer TonB [Rhizomicrobium sp.]|nr:energy transducer TonB [Rhizomicrobium sp.]
MKWLFGLLLLVAPAQAEEHLPSFPTPFGPLHTCAAQYPAEAVAAHIEGITIVNFTVAADGSVKDLAVGQSSGSDILDKASLGCVSKWLYKPIIFKGQSYEMPWHTEVRWYVGPHAVETNRLMLREVPTDCLHDNRPAADILEHLDATELSIDVRDWTIAEVRIVHSSGDTEREKNVVACIKTWKPKWQSGTYPLRLDWRTLFQAPKVIPVPARGQ